MTRPWPIGGRCGADFPPSALPSSPGDFQTEAGEGSAAAGAGDGLAVDGSHSAC